MTIVSFKKEYAIYLPSKIQNPTIVDNNNIVFPLNTSLHIYSLNNIKTHVTRDLPLLTKVDGLVKVKSFYEYGSGALGKFKYLSSKGRELMKENRSVAPDMTFIKPNQNVPVLPREVLLYNYNTLNYANEYLANPINPYYKAMNTLSKIVEVANIPVNRYEFINLPMPPQLPSFQELERYTTKKMSSGLINKLPSSHYFTLIELWKLLTPKAKEGTSFENLTKQAVGKLSIILNTGSKSIIVPMQILVGVIKEYAKDERYTLDTPKLKSSEFKKLFYRMLMKLYEAELNVGTSHTETKALDVVVDKATNNIGALVKHNVVETVEEDDITKVDIDKVDKEITIGGSTDVLVDDIGMSKADVDEIVFEDTVEDVTLDGIKTETLDVNGRLVNKLDKLKELGLITKNRHNKLTDALDHQRKIDVMVDGEVFNIGEVLDSVDDVKITKPEVVIGDTDVVKDKGMLNDTIGAISKKYISKQMKKDFIRTLFDIQKGDQIITDIQTETKASILGSTTTYTVKMESLDGGVNTVKMITHNIGDDGVFKQSGNSYTMRGQRTDLPIRKISHNEVSLTSNANKLFITRAYLKKDDIGYWLFKKISKMYIEEEVSSLVTIYAKVDTSGIHVPKHYEYISRYLKSFKFKSYTFNFTHSDRADLTKLDLEDVESNGGTIIGSKSGHPIVMMDNNVVYHYKDEAYIELGTIFEILDLELSETPLEYASVKVYKNHLPVILLASYYIGLENLLKAYKVTYHLVESRAKYDKGIYYAIKFKDHKLLIERDYSVNDIMFGGLKPLAKYFKNIDFKSLNKKDGFNILLSSLELGTANNILYITQIKQLETMFLDSLTIRVLKEMKEPTTFKGLLIRSIELLEDDHYKHPTDIEGMIIKGYERMPGMMYNDMYKAMSDQKNRSEFSKSKIALSPFSLIKKVNEDSTVVIVDDNNPISALKQREDVTYIGYGGRGKESMNKETRIMSPTEIGIISEASKDSGDVGISAYMSANPKINNTLGFTGKLDWDKDGWSSVLSTSALLAPLATMDDTKRLNFSNVQNSHIVPIINSEIPYVRTPYGTVLGSRVNDKFVTVAIDVGVVTSVSKRQIIVRYVDDNDDEYEKKYKIRSWYSKEEGGSTFKHKLVPNVIKGDKVTKDHVLLYDDAFFSPDTYDTTRVTYKQGVNLLVAMVEDPETYEDSTSLSSKTSELMSMDSIKIIRKTIPADKELIDLINVGDEVGPNTPLCKILDTMLVNNGMDDATMDIIQNLQSTVPTAKYEGVIEDIVVYYNCELEDMSKSIKSVVDVSDERLLGLEGYSGKVDNTYSINGKPLIKGEIELKIYIKVVDDMSIADKAIYANQLKCTVGDVYDKIITESNEEVDALFSTTSVQARIVGSVPIMGMLGYIAKEINEQAIELYYK